MFSRHSPQFIFAKKLKLPAQLYVLTLNAPDSAGRPGEPEETTAESNRFQLVVDGKGQIREVRGKANLQTKDNKDKELKLIDPNKMYLVDTDLKGFLEHHQRWNEYGQTQEQNRTFRDGTYTQEFEVVR
jgi:hypothetical protein